MTKKVLKILFVILILFSICANFTYATDIDFDLQNNETNTDVVNNENDENAIIDENAETPTDTLDDTVETMNPSQISTAPESGLSIGNIINILLITVGVIIILLAIAIIIRLKN